ncbi:MAG: hypothetical protein ACRDJC_15315 [Thermomicrobiales bacterium]
MRDQYAGDVSDFLKFAFLRALADRDRKLGVAWNCVPEHDGRPDGRPLEWRHAPAWQRLDPAVHAGLIGLRERSVDALERADFWPEGALFHREPMPRQLQRTEWAARKRAVLSGADIVFLDPDNGLGKETAKHATFSELRLLRRPGRAIVFITFPGKSLPHDALLQQLHDRLISEAGAETVITLRTNVSVPRAEDSPYFVQRQRWLTVVEPDDTLIVRARTFASALAAVPRVRARLDGAT